MSKTPIQTAIEKLVERYNETSSEMQEAAYAIAIMDLRSLLPTEREVIEEAWNTGKEDGKDMGYHGRAEHTSAQHYFTTKFNDNERTKS